MEYRPVGWVEPAIPIVWSIAHALGIARLHPTYQRAWCSSYVIRERTARCLTHSPDCIHPTGALNDVR